MSLQSTISRQMNIFQDTYDNRLRSWRDLRAKTLHLPLDQVCIEIDNWWQQVPLVNHHLHPQDSDNWPDPWSILSENTYCRLTRAIAICYTLLMNEIDTVELVIATDSQCEEHFLVLVDGAKYTLNWWPDCVISTSLSEFTIQRRLSIDPLKNKLRK